jgi:Protein of unknown function (DUF3426)
MHHFIRCPACRAVYGVPVQERNLSQTWLRCGICQHAFDGLGLGIDWPEHSVPKTVVHTTPQEPENSGAKPQLAPSPFADFEQALHSFTSQTTPLGGSAPQPPVPVQVSHTAHQKSLKPWLEVTAAVLLTAITAQGLWSSRFEWMEAVPALGRSASMACGVLGCSTALAVRNRVAIRVEQTQLDQQDDNANTGVETPNVASAQWLTWTVRNTASYPVLLPDWQVRLLNAQGQVVAQTRIESALLKAPLHLMPDETWQGHAQLKFAASVSSNGHRVSGIYP